MRRVILFILVLCLLVCSFVPPAYAKSSNGDSKSVVEPRFSYISSTSTSIGIDDGYVTVAGSMTCYPGTKNCSVVVVLQRREIGTSSWSDVTNKTDSGSTSCGANVVRACTSGYEYRAKAYYTAVHTSGAMETVTGYSRIAQYPGT